MRRSRFLPLPLSALLLAASCSSSEPPAPRVDDAVAAEAGEAAEPDEGEVFEAPAPPRDGAVDEGTELPDPATLPDVLLITLDTTRADRLGSYGYDKSQTDTLDRLAAKGRRYDRAYSPLPLTIPSHATLFTGTYPPTHGIRSNSDQVLGEDAITLAERLKAVGYRTGASVAAFVTTRRFGFSQGFDVYFDDIRIRQDHWHSERPANVVIDDILSWDALSDTSAPRFAWVHLYDAHFPYIARKGYESLSKRAYDAELAWVDDQVARLLEGFEDRPTMVVVVGDHGESLGEHHELAHGMQVYDATQRVPFFMAGPGIDAGEVVSQPVALADVAPILLDELGLPPLGDAEGLAERGPDAPPIYMEAYEMAYRFSLAPPVAVVKGQHKLIDLPKPELYDVATDPGEENNLADEKPEVVERLRDALTAMEMAPPSSAPGMGGAADSSLEAQLEALGYTAGSQEFDPDSVLPDPKDHADLIQGSQRSDQLARQQRFDEQEAMLTELAAKYPQVHELHARLARVRMKLKKLDAAREAIDFGLAQAPDNARLLLDLASLQAANGQFVEASVTFQKVVETGASFSPRVRVMAVASLMQSGDAAGAIALGERYLTEYPNDFNLAGLLGVHYVKKGEFVRALGYLEKGILADVPERGVAFQLAAVAAGKGERAESIHLLRTEVRLHPDHFRAVGALGRLLLADGKPKQVLDLVAPALQRSSDVPDLYFLKAQAQFNLGRLIDARTTLDEGVALREVPPADLVMLEANVLQQEGKPEEAQQAFQRAIELRKAESETATKTPPPGTLPGMPQ